MTVTEELTVGSLAGTGIRPVCTTNVSTGKNKLTICAPGCGNRFIEAGEQCDDGNSIDNDACSNTCKDNSLAGPSYGVLDFTCEDAYAPITCEGTFTNVSTSVVYKLQTVANTQQKTLLVPAGTYSWDGGKVLYRSTANSCGAGYSAAQYPSVSTTQAVGGAGNPPVFSTTFSCYIP